MAHCVLRSDAVGAPLVYITRSHPFMHMEGEETYRFAVRASVADETISNPTAFSSRSTVAALTP